MKNYGVKLIKGYQLIYCITVLLFFSTLGMARVFQANNAPVLENLERTVILLPNSGSASLTSNVVIIDNDSEQLSGAEIKFIDATYQTIVDRLSLSQNVGNISSNWNADDGILTLSGVDSKANYEKALRNVVYTFTNFLLIARPEVKKISISVSDGTNSSESVVRYVAVKNPDNVPSWITDFAKTVQEEGVLNFTANDFQSNYKPDPEEFTGLDIRQLPQNGKLAFQGDTLTPVDIVNNGGSFRIQTGQISQLTYTPNTDFAGEDYFEWNSYDGNSFATADAKVNINVTEVNDPPVLTVPTQVTDIPEDTPFLLPAITVEDVDDPQIRVELSVSQGTLSVEQSLIAALNFTAGDGQQDKKMQFSGTLEDANSALAQLTYLSDNNFTGKDELSVKASDRQGGSGSATVSAAVALTVIPTNDPPVIGGLSGIPVAYQENAGAVAIASALMLTDEENSSITSATIQIEEGYEEAEDSLGFTPQNGISSNLQGNTLTLSGTASLADYQKVLRSLTYTNTSQQPTETNRIISIVVQDEEEAVSEKQTLTLTIQSIDDAPVLSNLEEDALNFVQFGGPVALTNKIDISDADDESLDKAVISFSKNTYVKNEDVLTFENSNTISGSWNTDAGTLTLTGTATLADYTNALRSVYYENTSETPDTRERSVSIQVSSNGTNSNTVSREISIVANERPVISNFGRQTEEEVAVSLTYNEFLEEGKYQDPDNFPAENGFSRLAIKQLPRHGVLIANGDTLVQAQLNNAAASYEIGIDTLRQLVYLPDVDYQGNDSFSWNAFDGAQYAAEDARVAISIAPVNDAPLVQDFDVSVNEEDTLTFSTNDFEAAYTDAENDALQKIIVRSVPAEGALILNGIIIPANTEVSLANIGKLIYVPAENFSGSDRFTWSASDGNSSATQNATVSITVNPVNDAPLLKSFTRATAENEAIAFSQEDFTANYIDVEGDPLASVTIETLPERGQLLLSGQAINTDTTIAAGQIAQLTYQPAADLGSGRDTFSWNASDGNSSAVDAATVTIIVGVGVTGFEVSINEDEPYRFVAGEFVNNYGNPEGQLREIGIETLPQHGMLSLGGTAVEQGQIVKLNDISQLVYTPALHYAGSDSIQWNASDGSQFTEEIASVRFTIREINDAPELSTLENATVVAGDTLTLPFTVSDIEDAPASLNVSAYAENNTLISNEQLAIAGTDSSRTLTIYTQEGKTGRTTVTVLVSDGKQQVQQSFVLELLPYHIQLEAGDDIEVCNAQPLELTLQEISGGVAPYTYSWTCSQEDCYILSESGEVLSVNPETNITYYVQVTDANGIVSKQDTIAVNIVDCSAIDLNVPSGFTPNGDGINDTWAIGNIAYAEGVLVEVYNRAGQQVFQSQGYTNPWDGTSDGEELPVGTYYYVISVDNGVRVFKGAITILK